MTSFLPVFAALPTRLAAQPTLTVITIPQDDMARATGVMWFGTGTTPATLGTGPRELMSQFKIFVSYNGLPVTPTRVYCQVVEKDKVNPLKPGLQGPWENLVSKPVEASQWFVCKWRDGKPGVGVLDVYYVGTARAEHIADYILVVGASYTIGRTTVFGTEIQDICVLGFPSPIGGAPRAPDWVITKPSGDTHPIYADPLGTYASCEDLALQEQAMLGLPILWQ
jgi:hypothetical protein